jgi:LysR family transcriptional activator of nhaA
MSLHFSYRHLYYFWVVAQEGGMSRGAERLGMAVQTVSAQVRELERSLGHELLKPAGRGLTLTEAGRAAMKQAEQIFLLGEQLPAAVEEAGRTASVRLAVGISDSLPKLMVHNLLAPVLGEPHLRLLCHVGEFNALLAELALHKLDLVLADQAPAANPNLRLYSQEIASSPLAWYAPACWAEAARRDFPRSLSQVPVLLPSGQAAVRLRLDAWFDQQGIRPRLVGEFEDSALLKLFGGSGMGVFPAVQAVQNALSDQYHVQLIGPCTGVTEHFHAMGWDKQVLHPLVQRLLRRG